MQMIKKDQQINKLHEMVVHWNESDLNGLASLLSPDVTLRTPAAQIPLLTKQKEELHGMYHVLKFWKELFEKYSFECSNLRIMDVVTNRTAAIIDYPSIRMSAHCSFTFNNNGQISSMYFDKVMELGEDKQPKFIPLMARIVKNRLQTKFRKVS